MEQIDISSVTPFYTFDPLQGTEVSLFLEILTDCYKGIDRLAQLDTECPMIAAKLREQGASFSQGRGDVSWDDATIVFVALRATEADGAPSEPLERGISIERLGRFPTNEGNSIAYLRAHLIPEEPGDEGIQLLAQLDSGLRAESLTHDHLSIGFGGMILHGWLSSDDVTEMRTYLEQSLWKVNQNEPFDGGVREIVRHLLIVLKSAEKRNLGILMRRH